MPVCTASWVAILPKSGGKTSGKEYLIWHSDHKVRYKFYPVLFNSIVAFNPTVSGTPGLKLSLFFCPLVQPVHVHQSGRTRACIRSRVHTLLSYSHRAHAQGVGTVFAFYLAADHKAPKECEFPRLCSVKGRYLLPPLEGMRSAKTPKTKIQTPTRSAARLACSPPHPILERWRQNFN